MSFNGTEIRSGQTIYINGEQVTITDTSDAFCVVVTDKNGHQMSVRRSTLMSTPLFNFAKIKEENEERRVTNLERGKEYERAQQAALKEERGILSQINNIFREAGTKLMSALDSTQQALVEGLKKDRWAKRFDAVALGNRAFSCYMTATDAAHDNAMLA
jgi:hypothetical protein